MSRTHDREALIHGLRLQMDAVGVSPHELIDGAVSAMPTVAEAVANIKVKGVYTAKTRKTYGTGWDLAVELHGDEALDRLTFEDIEMIARTARQRAAERWQRRNEPRREAGRRVYDHHGDGAYESCLRALRALYRREYEKAGRAVEQAPAYRVKIPTRKASSRRGLNREELRRAFDVAISGGDDPLLDGLIIRAGYELGARQEGLINLRLMDLNHEQQTVTLDEKNDKKRDLPISAQLLDELTAFARERGAEKDEDAVFRYRPKAGKPGRPLTSRRFDSLCTRLRDSDPQLEQLHFVYHLLRHTVARRLSRVAGDVVARDFLGHAGSSRSVTEGYTRTLQGEVAAAWAQVMGVDHPLANAYDPGW